VVGGSNAEVELTESRIAMFGGRLGKEEEVQGESMDEQTGASHGHWGCHGRLR
jgi:hypothetical protein